MKLIDADNIDMNDVPCVYGEMTRLDYIQRYIDKQPELTASQVLEYISKYIGSIHKYEGTPVYAEPRKQSNKIYVVMAGNYEDTHPILTTTDREAAENFIKVFNKVRTYYQAYIKEFDDFCPEVPENFCEYIYDVHFKMNFDYRYFDGGYNVPIDFYDEDRYMGEYNEEIINSIKEKGYCVHLVNTEEPHFEVYLLSPKPMVEMTILEEEELINKAKEILIKTLNERGESNEI